mmetsp:Transcript_1794/g.2189  ORF Transcript_1794/g.2189 Transcript_1794/m.2189 type:complete len:106 (-) Transcript_1794:554-871(-)
MCVKKVQLHLQACYIGICIASEKFTSYRSLWSHHLHLRALFLSPRRPADEFRSPLHRHSTAAPRSGVNIHNTPNTLVLQQCIDTEGNITRAKSTTYCAVLLNNYL